MRLPRAADREAGMSLTEMLVTMLIFTIILAATTTMTIGFMRTNAQTINRQDQVDAARTAVEAMSRTLRTAVMPNQLATCQPSCDQDAFISGTTFGVKFYANVDNPGNTVGPSKVTYAVTTSGAAKGDLVEKIQVPDPQAVGVTNYVYCDADASGASAACKARVRTRVVARGVQVDGPAVFAYYKQGGGSLDPTASGLSAADLSQVLAIELTVRVQSGTTNKARPTTYIQRVILPNAQAVIRKNTEETP